MIFSTLISGSPSATQLHFKQYKNVSFDSYNILALSGDLTCIVDHVGQVYCWNTYDLSAVPHRKSTIKEFYDLSVYGSKACATRYFDDLYCTKNIKADTVDWVLVYKHIEGVTIAIQSVELDDSTVCIIGEKKLKCADFETVFEDKRAWKKKQLPSGSMEDITISGKHACANHWYHRGGQRSVCTKDISVDNPDWNFVPHLGSIVINKDKMCGYHNELFSDVCYKDGKLIVSKGLSGYYVIDNTHIVKGGISGRFYVAEFPK
eukprot:NODE_589_length_6347_cov_0.345711.p3 type:complete len:262 gc:universal NODE_589_length_6347_cov_0.345711:1379-2164(+)